MSPLQTLLETYRQQAHSQREKGNYFEELIGVMNPVMPTYTVMSGCSVIGQSNKAKMGVMSALI